jgi:4-hydroxythreonine-4-phosphate dehydrogenase
LAYLEHAVSFWKQGCIQALVTAPVTKWAVQLTRPSFVGQTEYLARAVRIRQVVMMFVSDHLRVVLLTRHLPLNRVARALHQDLLRTTLRLTANALTASFGVPRPRMVLCGLNPHAGEGNPRSEELRMMRPVLQAMRRGGLRCDGPFAADGLFGNLPRQDRGRYDAVICSYHDQGLIPFKMVARDHGCQMSLGLPFIRTSPDHGSALDIAGTGTAEPGSMRYALALAARLALNTAPSSA